MKAALPVSLMLLCSCGTDYAPLRRSRKDAYPDFRSLASANVEGRDYSREVYNRNSPVSVLAIHGGNIETATAKIARSVAGADFNLYIFNGWMSPGSNRLHLTADNFDDPQAVALSSAAVLAVSVHGQAAGGRGICVGGMNADAGRLMAAALSSAGFKTEFPCRRFPADNAGNIVNRARLGGVQLEMTLELRRKLANSGADLAKFTGAVRDSIFKVLRKEESDEKIKLY